MTSTTGRRSSSTTRPCATAPRARTSRSRSPTSCASPGCSTSTACPYIEGGWPGSNPKDIEFFAAARTMRWQTAKLAAFGSTRHRSNRPEADPNLRELVAAETPVVTIFGKSWLLHVTEVLGATPQENLDMIADSVGFVVDRGREAVYDAEHFFDGYKADRDYALVHAPRGAPGRRPHARAVRHERRHADRRAARGSSATSAARSRRDPDAPGRDVGHPHPQRRRAGRRQLDRRGRGRHPPRPGDDQRLRRALRQREHGRRSSPTSRSRPPHGSCPRAAAPRRPDRAVAERRRDRQRRPERLPAVRRPVGLRPQGRRPRRGRGQGRADLPARRPDVRRQRRPARRVGARRPGEHAIRAQQLGHELDGVVDPARAVRRSSSSSRPTGSRSRAPRRPSSCSSGATPPDYAAPFRIVDYTCLVEQRDGPRAARRGDRQGRGRRRDRSTPPPTATARSTRSTPRCARRCARSTRPSTTSTWSTTRCASSTATRRRRRGRA